MENIAEHNIQLANPAAAEILKLFEGDGNGRMPAHFGPYPLETVLRDDQGVIPLTITLDTPV